MLLVKVCLYYLPNEHILNGYCDAIGAFSYDFGAIDNTSNDFVEAYRNLL